MNETICIFSALYEPHLGGVENFTRSIAAKLTESGYRVIVVTNNHADLPSITTSSDGVEIYRLPCHSLLGARLPLPKRNKEFKELIQKLKDEPIDHICINTRFYPHSLIGAELAKDKGIVPVVIEHGSDYLTLGNPIIDAVIKRYEHMMTRKLQHFDPLFFAVSKRSSRWLRTFGIESNGEISNAIDADTFSDLSSGRDFRTELGIPTKHMIVSFIGRLVPEKGIEELIEAVRMLQGTADLDLIVAGDGPLLSKSQGNAPENVHLVGAIDKSDVVALLIGSDIFCLPSRSEGFATVLLEAAATNTVPVITNVGGVDELIPDEEYGIILEDRQPETIARALQSLCADRVRMKELADNIARRVRDEYNWQRTADALVEAFAEQQGARTQA